MGVPYEVRFVGEYCYVRLRENAPDHSGIGLSRTERFFRALAQALVADGWTLGEVPDA